MALNLLFLCSKSLTEQDSNLKIYQGKFGEVESVSFILRGQLDIPPPDDESSIMQKIGKKISQSRNFFN